tara:strand:+ start:7648 stop:9462 length:1815 start_codon:yes stop_codon:yes gene_type:complete
MKNTGIIIQARLGSTRFKNKVLKKINGKTIIEIMLNRLSFSKFHSKIIIAIPNNKKNHKLYFFLKDRGYNVHVGDEKNVLKRFYQTAKKNKLKNIIRLTSDCPLIDYKIVDELANKFNKKKLDYLSTDKNYAEGLDCEIISFKALEKIYKRAKFESEKEHVTLYLRNHKDQFKFEKLKSKKNNSNIRLTIDEKKDFNLIKKIVKKFPDIVKKKYISSNKIINFLNKNKKISRINSAVIRNEGLLNSYKREGIKILFITKIFKKTGTGNAIRLNNYSKLINKKNFSKFLLINVENKNSLDLIDTSGYKKINVYQQLNYEKFLNQTINFIQKYNIKILFVDLLTQENLYKDEVNNFFRKIKIKCNVKIILVGDFRHKNLNSDHTIIPQFVKNKFEKKHQKALTVGLNTFPFSKKLIILRKKNQKFRKLRNILIFISGSDPMHITLKMVKFFKDIFFKKLFIKIILSKKLNFNSFTKISEKIKYNKNIKIYDFNKNKFINLINWSNLNIVGEGSILIESIFAKKMTLVIKSFNRKYSHLYFLNYLKSKKLLDFIDLSRMDKQTIVNKLKNIQNLKSNKKFMKNNNDLFAKKSFNLNKIIYKTLKNEI